MNQEDVFLAEILASPQEESVRGVYADWFQDREDPRGEYLLAEMAWAKTLDSEAETQLWNMAATLDPVWVARVSRPPVGVCLKRINYYGFKRPKLTDSDLDWIEKRFTLKLPPDYRAFLLNFNGGLPVPAHLRVPGRPHPPGYYDQVVNLDTVWAAKESEIDSNNDLVWRLQFLEQVRTDEETYRDESQRWRGVLHKNLMIIGESPPSGGLEWFCLGCRGDFVGKVFIVNPFLLSSDDEDFSPVARTFAEFLGMLADYDPEHVQGIKYRKLATLRRWLDTGGDPNSFHHDMPLLMYAVMHSNTRAVRELLARGAKFEDHLYTYAQQVSSKKVVKLLWENMHKPKGS